MTSKPGVGAFTCWGQMEGMGTQLGEKWWAWSLSAATASESPWLFFCFLLPPTCSRGSQEKKKKKDHLSRNSQGGGHALEGGKDTVTLTTPPSSQGTVEDTAARRARQCGVPGLTCFVHG